MINSPRLRNIISYAFFIYLLMFSFYSLADAKPWVGTYTSTTSLMPSEFLVAAKQKGEDISSTYPKMVLRRNGSFHMIFFDQVQDKGSYTVRGKQLLTVKKNKQTGKEQTDDSAKFAQGYKSFNIKMGSESWTFTRE